jgi:WD40 repeat protein
MSSPASPDPCPYPGLRAFFADEREWFFGREAHVDAMLTCLESSRFLAVVGSSGSGKSSLVFAGLIPALCEGQLAGSRRDENGLPSPWDVVAFHPGNDPYDELAVAIRKAAPNREDQHLAGYIRAALESGDQGLVEALDVAGLIDKNRELLVYADQFEELFRFGQRSTRAEQENALRFARLFVAAAEQQSVRHSESASPDGAKTAYAAFEDSGVVRIHMLLSMRSEFIGECERYSGLPEIVSRGQFLTPRLNRKQLEQSLGCPADIIGWRVAPDALTAILNDCGTSPDQLPLAQHVLRRMWVRTAHEGRRELTLDDYAAGGGIRNSVAENGEEILQKLPKPGGTEVARILFMALCDQREEGPLVRRLSNRQEVETMASANSAIVPQVIAAFSGDDDPGFIREDKGWLDVRHEAILRQWPLISEWRVREAESEAWLRELAKAAKDYQKHPERTELWQGNDLRGAEEWLRAEKPSEAWASRHGVKNWDQCVHFLDQSRKHRQKRRRNLIAAIVAVLSVGAAVMIPLLISVAQNKHLAEVEAERRAAVVKAFAATADQLAGPLFAYDKSAFSEVEERATGLMKTITNAAQDLPPDQAAIKGLISSREAAEGVADAIDKLKQSLENAADVIQEQDLRNAAGELANVTRVIQSRREELRAKRLFPNGVTAIQIAIEARLGEIDKVLTGMLGKESLDVSLVMTKEKEIGDATAYSYAIDAIRKAALALGFDDDDVAPGIADRLAEIEKTLTAARGAKPTAPMASLVPVWKPEDALAKLSHSARVNRIRFARGFPVETPLIVAACEDGQVWFWTKNGGEPLNKIKQSSAVNDVAFSLQGDAVATASNGSTVRVYRWTGALNLQSFKDSPFKASAFERHSDSITDVEFSHGGQRIASASADRTVRVFDSRTLLQYYSSPPLPGIVTAVMFHPGDNLVVSGCDDGGVRLHTIDQPEFRLLGQFGAPARRPEFSPDGKFVVAASGDKTACVWTIVGQDHVSFDHKAPVTQATFRPIADGEGHPFVTTATNGEVSLCSFSETLKDPHQLILKERHPGAVVFATWSADGHWLATVGGGEVILWEWVSKALVARLLIQSLQPATSRAEFSTNGRLLVTYGGDQIVYVWDLTTPLHRPSEPPPYGSDRDQTSPGH